MASAWTQELAVRPSEQRHRPPFLRDAEKTGRIPAPLAIERISPATYGKLEQSSPPFSPEYEASFITQSGAGGAVVWAARAEFPGISAGGAAGEADSK